MKLKGTVTHIFAEKESGFKIIVIDVRDIKSIEPDKRNPDFPGSVTVLGMLKGVKEDYVVEVTGEWENAAIESAVTKERFETVLHNIAATGAVVYESGRYYHPDRYKNERDTAEILLRRIGHRSRYANVSEDALNYNKAKHEYSFIRNAIWLQSKSALHLNMNREIKTHY